MPLAPANGIEICYETIGDEGDPPLLLVMGLGAQLITWPDDFCAELAGRGFRVIRFDNRDVGLSTAFDDVCPDALPLIGSVLTGQAVDAPYTLADMAADAFGLLTHLGVASADVVGASMGGMIAQQMAVDDPGRIRSLTSIMSTTGDPDVGGADIGVLTAMAAPLPTTRDEVIEQGVAMSKLIGGPDYWDEDEARTRMAAQYDRRHNPAGTMRQLLAIMTAPSRTDGLRNYKGPALVVHGKVDPLVSPTGGERTAEALPEVETLYFDEMGHDLPEALWPEIVEGIVRTTRRAA